MTTTDSHIDACRCIWCASDPDKTSEVWDDEDDDYDEDFVRNAD